VQSARSREIRQIERNANLPDLTQIDFNHITDVGALTQEMVAWSTLQGDNQELSTLSLQRLGGLPKNIHEVQNIMLSHQLDISLVIRRAIARLAQIVGQ
jgi:hypothetical protein